MASRNVSRGRSFSHYGFAWTSALAPTALDALRGMYSVAEFMVLELSEARRVTVDLAGNSKRVALYVGMFPHGAQSPLC